MTLPYTGGCTCGAIRYSIVGEPAAMNLCQCRTCQRESGTGHGAHLTFAGAEVTLTGTATLWETRGVDGTRKRRGFCPTCGAPVFIASAASLDDPSRYRPEVVYWTRSGHGWDTLDPALTRFDRLPPELTPTGEDA